jgi:hypothetical protein
MANGQAATRSDGKPVETREVTVGDEQIAGAVETRTTTEQADDDENDETINPLGEEMIRVRARDGVDFWHQGIKRVGGDEFSMTITQARAASMVVDQLNDDGTLSPIPNENQVLGTIPRANVAGLQRHERVAALKAERAQIDGQIESLTKRRESLDASITRDERALSDAQAKAANDSQTGTVQAQPGNPVTLTGAPVVGQAVPPSGAPNTTSNPPRQGEGGGQGGSSPVPPQGAPGKA